ncbi:MAG: hypothetical protein UD936_06035 [Acutalibacteraceae bacterium]|nr:hypothetical protein [Acutalibacteraceae bacterium]
MSLFTKKSIDITSAEKFWQWFSENEEWIKANIKTNGMDVIWTID